ncbi:hypothetical protein MRB53_006195 [Persea americana]|uniref:Uncharacterized protein n=1 Tax=Persea americana TaxID=3435 RepID=A0ACC2MH12_PERAE|nr:hypothetical protein MRB53_006195 [Persea americana]
MDGSCALDYPFYKEGMRFENRVWIVLSKQQRRPSIFAVAVVSSGSVAGAGGAFSPVTSTEAVIPSKL